MNNPLPADLHQRFDLLIDTGTLEHCFNVGQAFKNTCEAMRQGGLIVHGAPLNRFNHGFWSFNPTLYHDFLGDNGFQILWLKGVQAGPGLQPKAFDLPPFGRFNEAPAGSAIVGIFRNDSKKVDELKSNVVEYNQLLQKVNGLQARKESDPAKKLSDADQKDLDESGQKAFSLGMQIGKLWKIPSVKALYLDTAVKKAVKDGQTELNELRTKLQKANAEYGSVKKDAQIMGNRLANNI